MSRAVRFDHYGSVQVLDVVDVDAPIAGPGEALVEVVAAGINPGEVFIREGLLHDRWPATFPSGQGSDFAGRVVAVGDGVTSPDIGDEVIGFTDDRAAQADLVAVPADQLTARPATVDWNQAGALYIAGSTAYSVTRAMSPQRGRNVVVTGAAGGVGSLLAQLVGRTGARVIGVASETNHDWLQSIGAVPVAYGEGLEQRLRIAAPQGIDMVLDTYGDGYVDLSLRLGVPPKRINTIIDLAAAQRHAIRFGGSSDKPGALVLADLAAMIAAGDLTVPIEATFALENVRDAYTLLSKRHLRGKVVLRLR